MALGELIACSAQKSIDGKRLGINNLRWAVLAATGMGGRKRKMESASLQSHGRNEDSDTSRNLAGVRPRVAIPPA